ncbi:MAG: hypothetical protein RXO36_04745 [Candidatus Nanopusillus acidilobi]
MNICNYRSNISLLGGLRIKDFGFTIDKFNLSIHSVKPKTIPWIKAIVVDMEKIGEEIFIEDIIFSDLLNREIDYLRFRHFYKANTIETIIKMSFLGSKYF